MGFSYTAICRKCATRFTVRAGGGFFFHLLHCTQCGKEKSIGFNKLGDIHTAYLKGLKVPYVVATAGHDAAARAAFKGEAITQRQYHGRVGKFAGECSCGGRFTMRARPRCPQCRSAYHKEDRDGPSKFYD